MHYMSDQALYVIFLGGRLTVAYRITLITISPIVPPTEYPTISAVLGSLGGEGGGNVFNSLSYTVALTTLLPSVVCTCLRLRCIFTPIERNTLSIPSSVEL